MSETRSSRIGIRTPTLAALAGLALLAACDARTPVDSESEAEATLEDRAVPTRVGHALEEGDPLVVVDGVVQASGADLEELNALDIERIEVVKGPAARSSYGERASDGVIRITTKGAADGLAAEGRTDRQPADPGTTGSIRLGTAPDGPALDGDPLIIVDGVVQGTDADLEELKALDIERIEVVKGPAAKSLYGERAADGVIQITTKDADGGEG